jgi:hypothetical protein
METRIDRRRFDRWKYNEFHKDGQKEDRTTAEIIEIASKLEKGERISCTTWIRPALRLTVTLDNRPYVRVLDIYFSLNATNHEFIFERKANQGHADRVGPWRDGAEMNIVDVIEAFQLDDEKINNQNPTSNYWTGWFLFSFQSTNPTEDNQHTEPIEADQHKAQVPPSS